MEKPEPLLCGCGCGRPVTQALALYVPSLGKFYHSFACWSRWLQSHTEVQITDDMKAFALLPLVPPVEPPAD